MSHAPTDLIELLTAMLARTGKRVGREIVFLCPIHEQDGEQHNPSARWNPEKGTWYCDVCAKGGGAFDLAKRLGVDLTPFRSRGNRTTLTLDALARDKAIPADFLRGLGLRERDGEVVIPYRDAGGKVLAEKRRTALVARMGSYWPEGAPLLAYGRERLGAARAAGFLLLVEGESDCWTLWLHRFPALGLPGAGTAHTLEASDVEGIGRLLVVREPGKGGATFVRKVAARLAALGWRGDARIIPFPSGTKDPNDLHRIDPGRFSARFGEMMAAACPLPLEGDGAPEPGGDDLPAINAAEGDLARVANAAWEAIRKANAPPFLFRHGSVPSRIERDENGRTVVCPLNRDRLRHHLARVAAWYRPKASDLGIAREPARPPFDVVRDMLACPEPPLPVLTRIVDVPVFGPDGTLLRAAGYHEAARILVVPACAVNEPAVADLGRARTLIVDDLLGDFPFAGDAERAHAVALMLLPFVRDLIDGPTPLHLIEKPDVGTGAGLLAEVLAYPALGSALPVMTEGRDEDEWRKRITAKLVAAPSFVFLDNLTRTLDSAALSAALTATYWEDRIMGVSENARLPVRCAWVSAGNNPTLSREIARRTVRIRLDAGVEHPWRRRPETFRHPELRQWAREHRGDLVGAVLVLVLHWLRAGRPAAATAPVMGSFESWCAVMGGILAAAGIPGFLGNMDEAYEAADPERASLQALVEAWWEAFAGRVVTSGELLGLAQEAGMDLGDGPRHGRVTRLGKKLGASRDRRVGLFRVASAGSSHGAQRWKLVAAGEGGEGGEVSPTPRARGAENGPDGGDIQEEKKHEGGEQGHHGHHPHPNGPAADLSRLPISPLQWLGHATDLAALWDDLWSRWQERAATLEIDGGLPREEAERRAWEELAAMGTAEEGWGTPLGGREARDGK